MYGRRGHQVAVRAPPHRVDLAVVRVEAVVGAVRDPHHGAYQVVQVLLADRLPGSVIDRYLNLALRFPNSFARQHSGKLLFVLKGLAQLNIRGWRARIQDGSMHP